LLTGWEGYVVGTTERVEGGPGLGRAQVRIELLAVRERDKRCSGCGGLVEAVHDSVERWVRDLPILDADTHLCVWRFRVACPQCGPKLERLDWLPPHARVTRRLAEAVSRACRILTIKDVSELFGLGWDQVKAIDKAMLEERLGPPDLSDVTEIALDEFAIHKGQRYATLIVEPGSKRVLWVCRGRTREDIRPFFEALGPEGRARIRAVAMDMFPAYEEEVRAQCPNAEIVFDLFHVMANYGREVIDRTRVDAANQLRHDKPARKVVKSSRWLLLRNPSNLDRDDRIKLRELLAANKPLLKVYLLKDDLKRLWSYRREGWARAAWTSWYRRAMRSGIPALKRFARNLRKRLDGILGHCRYPLHTSLLEGINNKVKVIKRMAYGFRDDAYFFLRIRAAFPGNAG
jgi:transposase